MSESKTRYARAAGKTVEVNLRLPVAVYDALKSLCRAEGVSMNLRLVDAAKVIVEVGS